MTDHEPMTVADRLSERPWRTTFVNLLAVGLMATIVYWQDLSFLVLWAGTIAFGMAHIVVRVYAPLRRLRALMRRDRLAHGDL